jgi:hypothetical protein
LSLGPLHIPYQRVAFKNPILGVDAFPSSVEDVCAGT